MAAGLTTSQTDLQPSHSPPGPVARALELQEEAGKLSSPARQVGQVHELQLLRAAPAPDLPWSTDPGPWLAGGDTLAEEWTLDIHLGCPLPPHPRLPSPQRPPPAPSRPVLT